MGQEAINEALLRYMQDTLLLKAKLLLEKILHYSFSLFEDSQASYHALHSGLRENYQQIVIKPEEFADIVLFCATLEIEGVKLQAYFDGDKVVGSSFSFVNEHGVKIVKLLFVDQGQTLEQHPLVSAAGEVLEDWTAMGEIPVQSNAPDKRVQAFRTIVQLNEG
jgi:hypothetical protein